VASSKQNSHAVNSGLKSFLPLGTVPSIGETLGRFALVRRLGEGGFGVVYEADDPRHRARVALKVLKSERLPSLARFKNEFRALADLTHPNLVRLYELSTEAETWYYAMELIDGGVTFLDYVRGQSRAQGQQATATMTGGAMQSFVRRRAALPLVAPVDSQKLRRASLDLAEAAHALHRARKLHCDLKPSNVLVTQDDERVVVLDFGLVTDIDDAEGSYDLEQSTLRPIRGTPGYMAPEQAARQGATEASDWYSVGAMIYEAMTGTLPSPIVESTERTLLDASGGSPEHQLLAQLAIDLLARDPKKRPSGDEVLERLRQAPARPLITRARRLFVGRDEQLALLRSTWSDVIESKDTKTVVARIVGSSGMGKTALAQHFVDEIASQHTALVLRGRSYEQESVPYKVFDGVVDALVSSLPSVGELIPKKDAPRLARLFRAFHDVVPALEKTTAAKDSESQAERQEAFIALRGLLCSISAKQPLLVVLDDLHWGDVDSARLLAEIARPPHAPRMMIVATQRPETARAEFAEALSEALLDVEQKEIPIGELAADDALKIANDILDEQMREVAVDIAKEGGGHPIFIQQLAERAMERRSEGARASGLAGVILERFEDLDPRARELLRVVALAGRPVNDVVAAQAAGLTGAEALKATSTVRGARLLVTTRDARLELAHDRVREAISEATPIETSRLTHRRLADALLAHGGADPEELVQHFDGAGDSARVREYGELAATRAESAYAFDHAAQAYAAVLRHTDSNEKNRWRLLARWADALGNAGRGGEAGDAFQQAADALHRVEPNHLDVITFGRKAGEHALRSGRLDLGTERMSGVLARVGVKMPTSRSIASAQSVVRRLRLFARGTNVHRDTAKPDDGKHRARLDALWAASTGLSMANHVVADALGVKHLLEALDAGDSSAIVRGLGYEAAFEAVIGGSFLEKRCRKILAGIDDLAKASNSPYDQAWAEMSKGVTSWFLGGWEDTWTHCTEASRLYRERCRGVAWELAICDAYRLPSLTYLGDLPKVAELVPLAFRAATERGDLFAASNLRMGQQGMVLLARDRPADAIREAKEAIAAFSSTTYLLPHYHFLLAEAQAELYRGNAARAWQRVNEDWKGMGQAKLLLAQFVRIEIRHLRARAALALAAEDSGQRSALVREAEKESNIIAKDRVSAAMPFAESIRAGVATLKGKKSDAKKHLEQARSGFAKAKMKLYEHAVMHHQGAESEATAFMSSIDVKHPASMISMLVPAIQ
jgi:eukaryotic-like serine/threonine-protein kinase